jgi:hypothetical protein
MKKVGFGYVLLTFLVAYSFGKFIGGKKKQTEIENRAKQINKEYYTQQDLKIIIFNEIQE